MPIFPVYSVLSGKRCPVSSFEDTRKYVCIRFRDLYLYYVLRLFRIA